MLYLKHIAILLLLFCNGFTSLGQPVKLSFQNFTQKDGLSDNGIYNFYQDTRGYLWVCTAEGLNRFDGFTFKKFYATNKPNSLPSNIVSQVFEYIPGYLLVATSNGMVRFNMFTNSFEPVEDTILSKKSANIIWAGPNGRIYAGYSDGFAIIDSSLKVRSFIKSPGLVQFHTLRSGELLIATPKGYYFVDEVNHSLRALASEFNVPFPQGLLFSYYDSVSNSLFTSQWKNGLYIIDLSKKEIKNYRSFPACRNCRPSGSFYCAFKDDQQRMWIGGDSGIFVFKDKINELDYIRYNEKSSTSFVYYMIWRMYQDRSRNLWFGTPAGMSRLSQKSENIRQYKDEFIINDKHAYINSILRGYDKGLYISTYGNGVFRLDEEKNNLENIGRMLLPFNWSLANDGERIIATGHDQRIYSYNTVSRSIEPLNHLSPEYGKSNLLLFSFTHSSGDKWYSLNEGEGLVLYSIKEKRYFHYTSRDSSKPFSEKYFSLVAEDQNKNLWFAVNRSTQLVCWEYKTRRFKTISFNQSSGKIHSNFAGITDIVINGNEIWVATSGSGLILYHPESDSISTFSINEGLASDVVNSLIFDSKKRLWAGTAKGLSCLLSGQKFFNSFASADGLPEINFSERTRYYDPVKNKLYLGAQFSMLVIDPDDLLQNKGLSIQAHLDGIKVNGTVINYQKNEKTVLRFDQNNLQFNFSVVDLNSSSGINLQYQLKGADKDWIKAEDQRTASYINLPAGDYQLLVKISKPGSDFYSESNPFSFTIKQAWWKTVWFRALLSVLSVLILYLIIRMYYRSKLEHQQMVFEKKQAVEQERTRIATDMHDDLGAGLTGIKFLSENIVEYNVSPAAKLRLEKLKGSANKLIESMGEIIWAMNEKNNTLEDLLFHLRSYSLTYCEENMLACRFNLPETIQQITISGHTRRNIFLIVKESLHNIVKHGNARNVDISVIIKKELVFEIQDDGKGFNPGESPGNGLINMLKRSKEMKGNFTIANNKGTLVRLRIPLVV